MTTIDELPAQFEALFDRARTAFSREVSKGQKALDALNAEKSSAQKAVSELHSQIKLAQAQLSSVNANLGRGSTLAGFNTELRAVSSAVEKLNAEKAALEISVADLAKQLTEAEAQLTALRTEADEYRLERADAYADIDKARALANGWRM